jgi:hypothetical protein
VNGRFPGYALPLASDNEQWVSDLNKREGGPGCVGVARADFNGDGSEDFAFLLSSDRHDHNVLAVALRRASDWQMESLRVFDSPRKSLYVGVAKPGNYERSEALDGPTIEPGEVESHRSSWAGVISGVLESSGIYYFRKDSCWVHLWIEV